MRFQVRQYKDADKDSVIAVVLSIQNDEFGIGLGIDEQPDLQDVFTHYIEGNGGFWVAVTPDDKIIGTVGLMRKAQSVGVMKKFFVLAPFRGRQHGVAAQLYETMITFAQDSGIQKIILDTPSVATRSHAFYRGAGFREIGRSELPVPYEFPDRNSILMMLDVAFRDTCGQ